MNFILLCESFIRSYNKTPFGLYLPSQNNIILSVNYIVCMFCFPWANLQIARTICEHLNNGDFGSYCEGRVVLAEGADNRYWTLLRVGVAQYCRMDNKQEQADK